MSLSAGPTLASGEDDDVGGGASGALCVSLPSVAPKSQPGGAVGGAAGCLPLPPGVSRSRAAPIGVECT